MSNKKPDDKYLESLVVTLIQQLRITHHVRGAPIDIARATYAQWREKICSKLREMKPSTRGRIASLGRPRASMRGQIDDITFADVTDKPLDMEKGGEGLLIEIACRVIVAEVTNLIITARIMEMAGGPSVTVELFEGGWSKK